MIRITDKSFRYTASYNTDIKKTFRKIGQAERVAAANSKLAEATKGNSVVPMVARRSAPTS